MAKSLVMFVNEEGNGTVPRMALANLRAEDLARQAYCIHSTKTVNCLALSKMFTVSIISGLTSRTIF